MAFLTKANVVTAPNSPFDVALARPAGAGYAASPIATAAPNEWPHEAALAIVGLPCAIAALQWLHVRYPNRFQCSRNASKMAVSQQ
jgi:hypothetical protein